MIEGQPGRTPKTKTRQRLAERQSLAGTKNGFLKTAAWVGSSALLSYAYRTQLLSAIFRTFVHGMDPQDHAAPNNE